MGYIKDDTSINTEGVFKQRRRRYSIVYLANENVVDKHRIEIAFHIMNWMKKCQIKSKDSKTIKSKSYIRKLRGFVEAVWCVIYAIREINDNHFNERLKFCEKNLIPNTEGIDSLNSCDDSVIKFDSQKIDENAEDELSDSLCYDKKIGPNDEYINQDKCYYDNSEGGYSVKNHNHPSNTYLKDDVVDDSFGVHKNNTKIIPKNSD